MLALRDVPGVRVVVADSLQHPLTAGLADAVEPVPPLADPEPCLRALLAAAEKWALDWVLPSTAHELRLLARERARFEARGLRVAVPASALVETLLDKRASGDLVRGFGLAVPEDAEPGEASAARPLIAKPRHGWGGRGHAVLHGPSDWKALADSPDALRRTHVVQRLLEAREEISLDFSVDLDGRPSLPGARRRLRVSGGFAVASETVADADVARLAERLARSLAEAGARGVLNAQLLRVGDALLVIDVNPRLATSVTHWIGTQANPLRHLLGSAAEPLAPAVPRPGARRRTLRRLTDVATPLDAPAPLGEIRGFVFDLDDTLVPQKRWILARLEALVEAEPAARAIGGDLLLGHALRLVEEGRTADLFDALQAELGLAGEARDALLRAYREQQPRQCPLHDDVLSTLSTLRLRGRRLALLCDSPPESQRRKLAACGLEAAFDAVVMAREHGGEKPALGGFRAVEAALGLPPEALAMVGNNPYRDAAGALAAGWGFACLVRRPGSLSDFDHELYRRVLGPRPRVRVVAALTEILDLAGG